jgi:predicted regulator of Ras-like GTPase activity (Roadblock/LC7/MglB family)
MYGISEDSRKYQATAVSRRVDSEKVQEHSSTVNAAGKNVSGERQQRTGQIGIEGKQGRT